MVRREDGQILPGMLMLVMAVFALGIMAFQIGKATILRSEAQTAADAAALAAARNVKNQLMAQVARYGTSDLSLINSAQVVAAARTYARRNGAVVTSFERQGVDVKVKTRTAEKLGKHARPIDSQDTKGEAKARARVGLFSIYSQSGGAQPVNLGPLTGGGSRTISDSEWDEFAKTINRPPRCTNNPSDNDVVKLGHFLRSHGAIILENNAFERVDFVHTTNSYHYRCNYMGALDVNYTGNEMAIIDALIGPLRRLGFRTIWRTTGHFDHLHVDAADGGSIIGSGVGGAAGPLEDTTLDVQLIDWEAPYAQFMPWGGGGGGGTYGGPPDPQVARTICDVARQLGANRKVILSAYEAAIVESGVHNLNYGDRDSLGVFQQRPSQGWGTPAQIMNPAYASYQYLIRAIRVDRQNPGLTPGRLAQAVQRSAFPERYDQRQAQAMALMQQYCPA